MNYVLAAVVIGLLILIHETGHFLAARWSGIPVARFSIGFGPRLWGFRRGGTDYWLSAIPLGGYVLPAINDEKDYFNIPLKKRLVFSIGGPLANLLLPVPLFALLALMTGDVSAQGLLVTPWLQTLHMVGQMLEMIPQIFAHPGQMQGIVGIVALGGEVVTGDLTRAIQFAILLSINLAVLNLLPIPALDGGKIVLHLLEKVHPKAVRLYMPLSAAGIVFLLGLMAYATVMDIGRLWS
jgi:regulator of sigma E protease